MFAFLRRIALLPVIGLIAMALYSRSAKAEDQNLWPFQVGNTWTVTTPFNGKVITQVITVTALTAGKDSSTATLEYRTGSALTQKEIYRFNAHGISRMASGANSDKKIYPGIPIVQYPVVAGGKWYWNGTITTAGKKTAAAATLKASGPEEVVTPAGKFKAFKVHMDLIVVAGTRRVGIPNDYWFAPGVGLIRQSAIIGKTTITGTLTSYKLQQAASQP